VDFMRDAVNTGKITRTVHDKIMGLNAVNLLKV